MTEEEPIDLLQALQDSLDKAARERAKRRADAAKRELIARGGQP